MLRVALALGFFWNPVVVTGGYLAAGVVVLFSRLVAPNPRPVEPVAPVIVLDTQAETAAPDEDQPVEELAAAA